MKTAGEKPPHVAPSAAPDPPADTWHMYIVRCADGTLYTGATTDVARRIIEHNAGGRGAKYTRSRRPVVLVYTKGQYTRENALRAEHATKALTRAEKMVLIAGVVEKICYRAVA